MPDSFSSNDKNVFGSLEQFFIAASDYDYVGMQDKCLNDFYFIENGESWTLDELITFMDPDKGKVLIQYSLSPQTITVKRSLAWIHFTNRANILEGENESIIEWKQSAALRKKGNKWLLIRIEGERLGEQILDTRSFDER